MERSDGVVGVPSFLLGRRMAKVLEDLPIPIIFSSMFYFMVGLRSDAASFGIFLAVSVASQYSAVYTRMPMCSTLERLRCSDTDCESAFHNPISFLWLGGAGKPASGLFEMAEMGGKPSHQVFL